jgi:hypothetical protein
MPMSQSTSSPTWDEYFAEAFVHLAAVRTTIEQGAPAPAPPEHPEGPIPDERRDEAQRLALGYDQLAAEVARRMEAIAQRWPSSIRRGPHYEKSPARFIDTPA